MEMMPAGKYWPVARDEIKLKGLTSKSTLYYPGVRNRDAAEIISIEPGNYVDNVDIKLPSDEERHEFKGRIRFEDGAPAVGAGVTFSSSQHGYTETTATTADGSFDFFVVANEEGQLEGEIAVMQSVLASCPWLKVGPKIRGIFRFMNAGSISVSSDSDRTDLELVIPSQSCKDLPFGRR